MPDDLQARIARRREVLDRIRAILIGKLGVRREADEIDPDTPLFGSGLGLDSVDAVELLVSLEMEFGVELPGDVEGRAAMRTVNTLADLVLRSADARGAGT